MKAMLIKIPIGVLCVEIGQLTVKFIWKCEEPRLRQDSLKENEHVARLILSDLNLL